MRKNNKKTLILVIAIMISLIFPVFSLSADEIEFSNIEVEVIDDKTAVIKWNTNINTFGRVDFGKSSSELLSYIIDNTGSSKYHKVEVGNLQPETKYYYQIKAYDSVKETYSFIKNFNTEEYIDDISPKITNVKIPYITGELAVIEWTTDENASSYVKYGDENNKYKKSTGSSSRVKNHRVVLKGLSHNTKYFLQIYSKDKAGNKSSVVFRELKTYSENKGNEDLIISYLRPSSTNDSYISKNSIKVAFKTNHYAKGTIILKRKGMKTIYRKFSYGLKQEEIFTGLTALKSHNIYIDAQDIFEKKASEKITVKTKNVNVFSYTGNSKYCGDGIVNQNWEECDGSVGCTAYCQKEGQINNDLVLARLNINNFENWDAGNISSNIYLGSKINIVPSGTWFLLFKDGIYYTDLDLSTYEDVPGLAVQRVKNSLRIVLYGTIENGKEHINGNIEFYNASVIKQRNDIVEDNVLEKGFDGKGKNEFNASNDEVWINKNNNNYSYFWLTTTTADDGFFTDWQIDNNINYNNINNINNNNIVVAGAEFSYYTKATALYKTDISPNIYSILNGQRHYISSPKSFNEYGYDWGEIEKINYQELLKYSRARLIKSPEYSTVYFLYQKAEDKWLKIALNSPSVFISYPNNYWGNIVTINQLDIDSYPDVKLIKTKNNPEVYYLENNIKYFISEQEFQKRGFNISEIVEVNETHLNSYKKI